MRRRLANTRVTLQSEKLKADAENTELNYRTRVTTSRQDAATTLRLASIVTLAFIVIGFGLRLLTVLPLSVSVPLVIGFAVVSLGYAYAKFLQKRPATSDLLMGLATLGTSVLFGLVNYAPTTREAYLFIFGTGIIGAAILSHFITYQVCAFMAVNERIRRSQMKRWLEILSKVWTSETPAECPELAAYRFSFPALLFAFGIGYGVLCLAEQTELSPYAPMFGVIGFLAALPTLWILANDLGAMSPTPMLDALKVTWRALTTFLCYNRHRVRAAGLFVFPTKELRDPFKRDVALGVSLALLTTALVGVSVSSPWFLIERYWKTPRAHAATTPAKETEPRLSPAEAIFARQLPPERRASYIEAKKHEHQARDSASWWGGIGQAVLNFVIATAFVLLLCWLGPFAVFVAVLWFTGGRLLRSRETISYRIHFCCRGRIS